MRVRICGPQLHKGTGQRTVARTTSMVRHLPAYRLKRYSISILPYPCRWNRGGNVLYLENIFRFTGNDTGGFYVACLRQDEHFATFQITVYHGLVRRPE